MRFGGLGKKASIMLEVLLAAALIFLAVWGFIGFLVSGANGYWFGFTAIKNRVCLIRRVGIALVIEQINGSQSSHVPYSLLQGEVDLEGIKFYSFRVMRAAKAKKKAIDLQSAMRKIERMRG